MPIYNVCPYRNVWPEAVYYHDYCGMFVCVYLDWLLCESYIAICVPIVMYGLGLFIVVLQELHCSPNCLHVGFIMNYRSLSLHQVLLL